MSKPFEISIGKRSFGSIFNREVRTLEVTDKELVFSTLLGGTWPDNWLKKDITVKSSPLTMYFKVVWNDGKKATFGTYTKKTYLRVVLPYIFIAILGSSFVTRSATQHDISPTLAFVAFYLVVTAVYALILFIPYNRLKRELKRYGYIH